MRSQQVLPRWCRTTRGHVLVNIAVDQWLIQRRISIMTRLFITSAISASVCYWWRRNNALSRTYLWIITLLQNSGGVGKEFFMIWFFLPGESFALISMAASWVWQWKEPIPKVSDNIFWCRAHGKEMGVATGPEIEKKFAEKMTSWCSN